MDLSENDDFTLEMILDPNAQFMSLNRQPEVSTHNANFEEDLIDHTEAKILEVCGVKAAEQGDIAAALGYFTEAVESSPTYGSAYNNRAQALRLQGDKQGAQDDLDTAIKLSGGHGNTACQAYTQRAMLRRLDGDDDGAMADFKVAANLGGKFAKEMVVALNPYAALCNQMMAEVIRRTADGDPTTCA